jgi:FkbM family methyltransferase
MTAQSGQAVKVYVYGAGNMGKRVYRALVKKGVHVSAFLDQTVRGSWRGVPVLPPEEGSRASQVCVAVFNPETSEPDILQYLKDLGYALVNPFFQIHGVLADELGDCLWLSKEPYPMGVAQRDSVRTLLADDRSQAVWDGIMNARLNHSPRYLLPPDPGPPYFCPDLPRLTTPIRYIDCGAYNGDTIRDLITVYRGQIESVVAYEPNLTLYSKMSVAGVGFPLAFQPSSFAVGAEEGHVRFEPNGATGCVTEKGSKTVYQTTLDSSRYSPTFIKMDIEGAELDALWGARETLKRCRPELAICLYHRPAHLWQVPLLIDELCGPGKHYLRLYCHSGFGLVDHFYPERT